MTRLSEAKWKHERGLYCSFVLLLLLTLPANSCALRRQPHAKPLPMASGKPSTAQTAKYCPDRTQKMRTGGAVGTVVGTIAASLVGSPVLGGLYQVAGYAIGLASSDTCRKIDKPAQVRTLDKEGLSPQSNIVEEDI